jgi:TonB family protein
MRQSTLALICGLILFVILAYSWCGRNPPSQTGVLLVTPTPTAAPPPTASAAPSASATPSASASVTQPTATPTAVPLPAEFQKVAQKAQPAIVELTVFDAKGQLLRSGNAFYVSRDGLLVTSLDLLADAAYGVAKSPDGKIRNVTGIVSSSKETGLAIARGETQVGVPYLPLEKTSESIAVNAWAVVIGNSLQHKVQPLTGGMITARGADPKKDTFQISGAIPNDAVGAPAVDANGEVVGIVTTGGKNAIQPSGQLEPLLGQIKPGMTGRWGAPTEESPTPSPSPSPTQTPKFVRNPRILYNPAPRYPYELRMFRSGPTSGSGKYRVTFDGNGLVKKVQIVESSGQAIMDQAAIKTLQQWKAEAAGRDWTVLVPITFQP